MLKYVPLSLLVSFSIKGLVNGLSFVDASVILILAASYLFEQYKTEKAAFKKLQDQHDELKKKLTEVELAQESLKQNVSTIKLSQQARGLNNVQR